MSASARILTDKGHRRGGTQSPFPKKKAPVVKPAPTYEGLCDGDAELRRWIEERDALSDKIRERRKKHRREAGKSS